MTVRQPAPAAQVCVVDDDPAVGCALGRLLRSEGYAAESFTSAEAFLAAGCLPESSVLVLDVRMPGMTGPELQQLLLQRGSAPPMLFISAVDDRRVREDVLAAGAAGWLSKPVDGEDLLQRIAQLLALAQPT